jgi:hypothetical protein
MAWGSVRLLRRRYGLAIGPTDMGALVRGRELEGPASGRGSVLLLPLQSLEDPGARILVAVGRILDHLGLYENTYG